MINKKTLAANLILLLTAMIWGLGFVAQRAGMEYVGPLTFGATRFALGALTLLPIILYTDRKRQNEVAKPDRNGWHKTLYAAGIACGSILFVAANFQQVGLVFTSAGKAAFITSLYIVLVPLFGYFFRHKAGLRVWGGVLLAAVGLFLLTVSERMSMAPGDLIVLIGAFFWALHILVIDHFLPRVDAIKLAFLQFAVASVLCAVLMLLREQPSLAALVMVAVPVFYSGILSVGAGFTLQIVGQRHTSPTVASLLLSMESVFGALAGYLLLKELLTAKELLGCILMFVAIILSQLPEKSVQGPDTNIC